MKNKSNTPKRNAKKHSSANNKKLLKQNVWYRDCIKHLFAKRALWALNLTYTKEYKELINRIGIMIAREAKRKNLRFCFQYLKDCYTICQFNRAGSTYTDLKHHVGLDKKGWPKIIPISLRLQIEDRVIFIAVCTLLGVFRIIPWWPKVDYGTIVNPFSGVSQILDDSIIRRGLRNILKWAGKSHTYVLKMRKSQVLNLLSSSPTSGVSLFGSIYDAAAFWLYPAKAWALIRWNWSIKGYSVACWFILLWILSYPIFIARKWARPYILTPVEDENDEFVRDDNGEILYSPMRSPTSGEFYTTRYPYWELGKLAVVKDVAGKSRVIAIVNYWIQVSLKPLHDAIFKLLEDLPTDGTFNQLDPVFKLPKGIKYSSYDLTAATDRLPMEVQRQVLSHLIGEERSQLWKTLLDIEFQIDDGGDTVKYSVGQPMGAYSSWACLALTHHTLLGSLYKLGETPNYAILGDDMCTTPDKGAGYCRLMEILGVPISKAKSLLDSFFVEYAKKLIDKRTNMLDAILGPKLVARSIQNHYLYINILHESYARGVITKVDIFNRLRRLRDGAILDFGSFILFGPAGLIEADRNYALSSGLVAGQFEPSMSVSRVFMATFEAIASELLRTWKREKKEGLKNLAYYDSWVRNHIILKPPSYLRWYEFFLFVISPGFWIPLCAYRRAKNEQTPLKGVSSNLDLLLKKAKDANIVSFDLETKNGTADCRRVMRRLTKEWEFAYLNTYTEIDEPSYYV